ncbi:MAG TPA: hypothetical protein VF103_04395, partial [Polyangiaceae bacterium]
IAVVSAPGVDLGAATCEGVELKIVTESSDPETSLATVVTRRRKGARLARAGDELDGARVAFIGYNAARLSPAVWLSTPSSVCQALLFEPPGRPPEREKPEVTPPRALPPSRLRIVPDFENGAVVGFRMFGVRRDGVFALLGFENGDRVESINGFEVSTPEKALEAYARLRAANRLRVKLLRRGAPVTLDFRID